MSELTFNTKEAALILGLSEAKVRATAYLLGISNGKRYGHIFFTENDLVRIKDRSSVNRHKVRADMDKVAQAKERLGL